MLSALIKKLFLYATIALLQTAVLPVAADTNTAQVTGRLIVKYKADSNTPETIRLKRSGWRTQRAVKLLRRLSPQRELLSTTHTSESALRTQAQLLTSDPGIDYVAVEYRRYPLLLPNDPWFSGVTVAGDQSYLDRSDFSIQAPAAWDITTGSPASVIAIIDTGILPHPELNNRSVTGLGYDFVSADEPGVFTSANDGNARDSDPTDPGDRCAGGLSSWHGTSVASVAAANSNNNSGMVGIDWNARLLHARAIGKCGGTDADIIDAIRWSAGLEVGGLPINTTPATVINLSIGGPTECTVAWQDVIDELQQLNIPFVIAAGNESTNALRSSPANCADVITVGSSTNRGSIDNSFSNYGLKVTISAPGRNIVVASNDGTVTAEDDGYNITQETGSSFSAALVSGAISLAQSVNADQSTRTIKALLQSSATPFAVNGECSNYFCGGGILNLEQLVKQARDGSFDPDLNIERQTVEAQATTIFPDVTISDSLNGYRDIRYYVIETSAVGLLTLTSASTDDLYGYILDEQFSVLAMDDNRAAGNNFLVAARVNPGRYFLAVEHADSTGSLSSFELTAGLITEKPEPFIFLRKQNALVREAVFSNPVTIRGLTQPAIVTVSGGFYSINGGELSDQQTTINNGDEITVAIRSSGAPQTEIRMQITVGAYLTEFAVVTATAGTPLVTTGTGVGAGCTAGSGTHDSGLAILFIMTALSVMRRRQPRPVKTLTTLTTSGI